MEHSRLGNVGDDHLIAPLLADSRHLTDGQRFTERRADALGQRLVRERDAVVPRGGVGGASAFLKAQRVAELIRDKLTPSQRESLLLNEGYDIRRKVRGSVVTGHYSPLLGPL